MKVRLQQEKVLLFLPAENIGNLYDSFTKVCTRCHIACQVVPNGCLDQPIENWLSVSLQETEAESPALPGPMLLFCGLSATRYVAVPALYLFKYGLAEVKHGKPCARKTCRPFVTKRC